MRIALTFGAIAALVQPITGHILAQNVAERQPAKLAAMESLFQTTKSAPMLIGGWPDVENGVVHYAIEIPGLLSFLAHDDFNAEVFGLDRFPRDQWPPVRVVHIAFQVMVFCGMILAAIGLLGLWGIRCSPKLFESRRYLRALALATPLGFIAIEAGWIVTEVGRQPWIIYGVMRTKDALTPMPGLIYSLVLFIGVYLVLTVLLVWLMWSRIRVLQRDDAKYSQPKGADG